MNESDLRVEREAAVLSLSGNLTVWEAAELKEALGKALAVTGQLEVDLSRVEQADLAALQLLCAAHRAARSESKSLRLRTPGPLAEAAERAGLVRQRGCFDDCLWCAGGA